MYFALAIVTAIIFALYSWWTNRKTPYERDRGNLVGAYNRGEINKETLDAGLKMLAKKYKGIDL